MFRFNDKTDQEWPLDLDLGTLHEITHGGIDFSDVAPNINLTSPNEQTLEMIMFNPMVTLPILWFCVKDDLEGKYYLSKDGPTENEWRDPTTDKIFIKRPFSESPNPDIDFYRLFSQKEITEVAEKLLIEITNFFPLLAITIPTLIKNFSSLKEAAEEVLESQPEIPKSSLKKMIRERLQKTEQNLMGLSGS